MNRKTRIIGIFKKTAVVLWWVATILIMFTIVNVLSAKIQGKVPYFCGYAVMNIVSGSMGETIPEGSYILIQKTDPSEIRKGDIICFYSDDPAIKGYPNTHTVVEDPVQGENGLEFVTKGDANPSKDPVNARAEKLIGRHVTNLELLTKFSVMLEGKGIMIITIALPALCILCMGATMFVKLKREADEEAAAEAAAIQTAAIQAAVAEAVAEAAAAQAAATTSDENPPAEEAAPIEQHDTDTPQA